jgi:hypothetical protein
MSLLSVLAPTQSNRRGIEQFKATVQDAWREMDPLGRELAVLSDEEFTLERIENSDTLNSRNVRRYYDYWRDRKYGRGGDVASNKDNSSRIENFAVSLGLSGPARAEFQRAVGAALDLALAAQDEFADQTSKATFQPPPYLGMAESGDPVEFYQRHWQPLLGTGRDFTRGDLRRADARLLFAIYRVCKERGTSHDDVLPPAYETATTKVLRRGEPKTAEDKLALLRAQASQRSARYRVRKRDAPKP